MALALSALIVTSCGNTSKTINDTTMSDETTVEETIACDNDTTECAVNDSIVTRGGCGSEGFGRCLQSGCNCKEFEGRGQTCRNCGQTYKKHY